MNILSKIMVLGLLLVSYNNSKAQDLFSTVINEPTFMAKIITIPGSTEMNVYIGNAQKQKLEFTLTNSEGTEIYTHNISKKNLQARLKLNLSRLPNGLYNVEMSDKNSKSVKTFRKGMEVIVSATVETLIAVN